MIYNFPFYPHFPTKSYRSYPQKVNKSNVSKEYGHNYDYNYRRATSNPKVDSVKARINNQQSRISESTNLNTHREELKKEEIGKEVFFEILGIKLYSDDILLLCLLFFLYKEGVHDEYLFIALIMLLLS